ncbi:MAG: hypothetical protein MZU91_00550 [Desulfosudis oleivorans]|nr:hypothetical protein [Desulfosudis oleivorans]
MYGNWQDLENLYQIRLDPQRLSGDPVVVGGNSAKAPFSCPSSISTPPEMQPDRLFSGTSRVSWNSPAEHRPESGPFPLRDEETADQGDSGGLSDGITTAIRDIEGAVTDIIDLGLRNFLRFWRNPMLLQWRRGIRALEYCTPYILVREIARILENVDDTNRALRSGQPGAPRRAAYRHDPLLSGLTACRHSPSLLCAGTKAPGSRSRLALQNGHITYEKCNDEEIQQLRSALFRNQRATEAPSRSCWTRSTTCSTSC